MSKEQLSIVQLYGTMGAIRNDLNEISKTDRSKCLRLSGSSVNLSSIHTVVDIPPIIQKKVFDMVEKEVKKEYKKSLKALIEALEKEMFELEEE